jgi:hypothetical protein
MEKNVENSVNQITRKCVDLERGKVDETIQQEARQCEKLTSQRTSDFEELKHHEKGKRTAP